MFQMSHTNRLRIAAMVGLLVTTAFAASPAHAQVSTWNVTTGVWQTGGNWLGGLPTASNTAAFVGTSNESSSLNADASVLGLTFSGAGTKSITSDSTTARTLTIGGSGITINSGAGDVTLGDATNPLNLAIATQSWTNNSTSLFTVLGGITGTAASGTTTLAVRGSGDSLLSGVIGNGSAGGLVAFSKADAGTVTLSGNNTYSGGTTLDTGTLLVGHNSALGTGVITYNGGSLGASTSGVTLANALLFTNNLNFAGSNGLTISGNLTNGSTANRTLTNDIIPTQALTFSGTTSIKESGTSAVRTLTVQGGGRTTFSGPIVDGGTGGVSNLTIGTSGGGALVTLAGANTYSGTTTITAGNVLRLTNDNALGSSILSTDGIAQDATLELANNVTIAGKAVSFAGNVANAGAYGAGQFVSVSGSNTWTGSVAATADTVLYSNAGSTLVLSGSVSLGARSWVAGGGTTSLTGTSGNMGAFRKTGPGTLLLGSTLTGAGTGVPEIYGGTIRLTSGSTNLASKATGWTIFSGTLDLNGNNLTSTGNIAFGTKATGEAFYGWLPSGTANLATGSGTATLTGAITMGSTSMTSNAPSYFPATDGATISDNLDLGSAERLIRLYASALSPTSAMTISANISGTASAGINRDLGTGTLILSGSNSYVGTTKLIGTTVLDYSTNAGTKISGAGTGGALTLSSGGTLTLKGDNVSTTETVGSTTIGAGQDASITRSGANNTAKINLGAIGYAGSGNGVLNVADSTLAQTTTAIASGILRRVFVNGAIAMKDGSNFIVPYDFVTSGSSIGASGVIANASTTNFRITGGGGTATTGATATTINTLTNDATSGGTTTVDIGASGRSLTVHNGIVNGPGATDLNIIGSGTLASALFAINSSNAVTVNANMSSSPIIKSGTGMLVLAGTGAGTTALQINAGTVRLDNASAVGSAGTINGTNFARLQYGSGISLDLGNRLAGNIALDTGTNNVNFATTVTFGASNVLQKWGSGTLTLSATNNGHLSVREGTIKANTANWLNSAANIEVNGGTLDTNGFSTTFGTSNQGLVLNSGLISGTGTLTATEGAAYNLSNSGTIQANLSGAKARALMKYGDGTAVLSGSNSYTWGASSMQGMTWVAQGVLRLDSAFALPGGIGASGGTSGLIINGGVLGLGNGDFNRPLGAVSGGHSRVQIQDLGGGFAAYGGNRIVNFGGASAQVTWGAGSFMTAGGNSVTNPAYANGQGTFILGAADADATVDFQNPLALTAAGVTASDWYVNTTTRTIQVNNGSAAVDGRMSGVISDGASPMGIRKTGAGTLEFTAANTYTGPTVINAGQMRFTGTSSLSGATGAVTVDGSGAELNWNSSNALTRALVMTQGTLSGTGTISATGGVTIGTNATLSPGNSPGILPFTTGLTLTPGGTYVWEVNSGTGTKGTNWDLINVTGGGGLNLASLSGAERFNLDLSTLTASGSSGPMDNYTPGDSYTWRIFDANALALPALFGSSPYAAGTDITSLFNVLTANWKNTVPAANDISIKVAENGTGIDLVVVPEPSTVALAGIGIAAAAYALRRRRK